MIWPLAVAMWIILPGMAAEAPSRPAASSQPVAPLYSVVRFGAIGDGTTKNTAAIQDAIDAAASAGGGTVLVPAGRWLSGTLVLKNNVTLWLDNGAVLLGSTDLGDYPPHQPAYRSYSDVYVNRALVYAENAHHIAVVGRGTIDGQGGAPAFYAPDEVKSFLLRPYLIRFVTCQNVHVEGVVLRDSPMWTQQYLACDQVTVTGITVAGNVNRNNDFIDIDGCSNVRMTGCTGDTEDDGITLKSTGPRPCENVTISDCTVGSHCSAVKLGTESTGGFRNITINNIAIRPSRFPVKFYGSARGTSGISLLMVDGGVLENVAISNIVIDGTESPLFMRLGNRARKHVPDAPQPGPGTFRNVSISRVIATGAGRIGCGIVGTHRMEDITLRDINLTFAGGGTLDDASRQVPEKPADYPASSMFGRLPAYGFYARNVDGLTLDNVRLTFTRPDDRPAFVGQNVDNLAIRGLRAEATERTPDLIVLRDVAGVMITGCVGPRISQVPYLHMIGDCRQVSVIGNDLSGTNTPWRFDGRPQGDDNGFYASANSLPGSPGRRPQRIEE